MSIWVINKLTILIANLSYINPALPNTVVDVLHYSTYENFHSHMFIPVARVAS